MSDDPKAALAALVTALQATHWSSWQSTAHFDPALGAAEALLERERVRDAAPELLAALQWREQFEPRPGETSNDTFERVGEVFHRETHYLRPGKDCRVNSSEEREAAWAAWLEAGRARVQAAIDRATGGHP